MVNYSNGKIYKIEALNAPMDEKVYVGSTTKQYLSQRMDKHRSDYKQWKESKTHKITSFDLFDRYGVENCVIVLIELVNANSKDELHAREKHYIKTMNSINKCIPVPTKEERKEYMDNWKANNIEHYIAHRKQYRLDNKELIFEAKKKYREENKEKLKETKKNYHIENREAISKRAQEYREKNKDAIKLKKKEYYEANKEAINARTKEKRNNYEIENKEAILKRNQEYREKNKDAIKLKKKEYYEANKEAINARTKEKNRLKEELQN
jgi:hypothetical protein